MLEEVQRTYDTDALRRRVPSDRAEFFVGFTPWAEDTQQWKRSVRESHVEGPDRRLNRTVWDQPESRDARVLIDVAECASATDAIESLMGRLAGNQLARLPEGPADLGLASFVHPEGVPPAVFFTRGNLCVSVISFARSQVPVLPWAERLHRRLGLRPADTQPILPLELERSRAKVGEPVALNYKLPWTLGEGGYLKFFVEAGTLAREEKRLILRGARRGEVRLEALVLEPGRQAYGGRAVLIVE